MMKRIAFIPILALMCLNLLQAQEETEARERKYHIGVGLNAPLDAYGNYLTVTHKRYFEQGALRASLSGDYYRRERDRETSLQEIHGMKLGGKMGYEFSMDLDRFRVHYGADVGLIWNRYSTNYASELTQQDDTFTNDDLYLSLIPLVGVSYFIFPSLSVSLESQLPISIGFPVADEDKREGEYDRSFGLRLLPIGLFSINYHF